MNTQSNDSMPAWRGMALAMVLSGAIAAASGCAWSRANNPGDNQWISSVPEDQGMYAYTGEGLVRLDGDVEWEKKTWERRSNLPPNSELIIRDAELAGSDGNAVGLRRVAWLRSTINDSGEITPATGNKWVSAPLATLEVPLDYVETTRSDPDLVHLRPQQPLEPGLYALYAETAEGSRNARFGVAWPETDKDAYAASVCVDRYAGAETAYRRCQEQNLAGAGDQLQIYLVRPEKRDSSAGRSMVISGVILNSSSRAQPVPLLTAELRNAQGQALTSWRFKADSTELEPGQSTSFRTEVGRTSHQVHSVNVNFASTQASN